MKRYIFALALFLNVAAEQDLTSTLQQLTLDKNLGSLDPTHLDPSTLANIEEGEDLLRARCMKNGNNDTYEAVVAAKADFQNCIKGFVDLEEIQEEIEKAKPRGDLDTVFKKYCKKSPALKDCFLNYTAAIEPCLGDAEKSTKEAAMNVTNSLINFVCFKEGDRIALFIAEGGPECLKSKLDVIQDCMNTTFAKYAPQGEDEIAQITLDEDQCRNINEVQKCVVKELERCSEPTPANIVDSMFNFVRKSTPCSKYSPKSLGLDGSPNEAPSSKVSYYFLFSVSLIVATLI